jgi:DNA-binding NarL/FixJ family response regulator
MPQLSPRERQVLEHLAKGMMYKEAALEMGISVSSVRWYVYRAKKKLCQPNTMATVAAAIQLQLIVLVITIDNMTQANK